MFWVGKEDRPFARQDLIIVSDAHDLFTNKDQASQIKERRDDMIGFGVNIYGIGVGNLLNSSEFRTRIVSEPCLYRTAQEWEEADLTNTTGAKFKDTLKRGQWAAYTLNKKGSIQIGFIFCPLYRTSSGLLLNQIPLDF